MIISLDTETTVPRTCCVLGCLKPVHGREMCYMHYLREKRLGKHTTLNRAERALAFVDTCVASEMDECIEPDFGRGSEYPTAQIDGVVVRLGWLVLEKTKGKKPDQSMVMRHFVCGNSRCCNPRHLVWGTEVENMADKKAHGTEPDYTHEKNPNARLTSEQVENIRKRHRKGRGPYDTGNTKELAVEHGVTLATIQMIARGKTWGS